MFCDEPPAQGVLAWLGDTSTAEGGWKPPASSHARALKQWTSQQEREERRRERRASSPAARQQRSQAEQAR